MNKIAVLACTLAFAAGCATATKQFTVVVDPPDAEITVIPGGDLPVQKAKSPASFTVPVPEDPDIAAKGRVEIRQDAYKPKVLNLAAIRAGQTVSVQLKKMMHHQLKFRLLAPAPSDDLRYQDRILSVEFAYREHQFDMTIRNTGSGPFKILWERAEYLDYVNRSHRLIHTGIRPQDRNNATPPQIVKPGETLTEGVLPADSIVFSQEKRGYENRAILPVESERAPALKDRTIYLFLPLEVNRQIIPYNFKFQISEVVRDL